MAHPKASDPLGHDAADHPSAAAPRTTERPADAEAAPAPGGVAGAALDREDPQAAIGLASPGGSPPQDAPPVALAAKPATPPDVAPAAPATGTGAHARLATEDRKPMAAPARQLTASVVSPAGTATDRASVQGRLREPPPRAARGTGGGNDALVPDSRCRTIVLNVQLGEELSPADRSYLRNRCGARR